MNQLTTTEIIMVAVTIIVCCYQFAKDLKEK